MDKFVSQKALEVDAVKLPGIYMKPRAFSTSTSFLYLNRPMRSLADSGVCFVDYFIFVMYWNRECPMESLVELRYSTLNSSTLVKSSPIDPKWLRRQLKMYPLYRDAIVDVAPRRSFLKGLIGTWVGSFDKYCDRTSDSIAGSLVRNKGDALGMALAFPRKVKSLFEAERMIYLLNVVDDFMSETNGHGDINNTIQAFKEGIARKQKAIEECDIYRSEDFTTFSQGMERLRKYGIEYTL